MRKLNNGFTYYQSKIDLRRNRTLTEDEYDFLDEVKRSCAFYFYEENTRFVLTASYYNSSDDKTPPEFYISDMLKHKREQFESLEEAKNELIHRANKK